MLPALSIVLLALFGTACSKKNKPLGPNLDYSINLVATPEEWPREVDWAEDPMVRDAQQDAWARYGTPDYIRFVYTIDRRIVNVKELEEGHRMAGGLAASRTEWVYYEDDKVLSFRGPKIVEYPLGDQLKAICEYGDPNVIKRSPDGEANRASFTYYDHGLTLSFENDELVNTYRFDPMPGFNMRE